MMKKLLLMLLLVVGGVMNASATTWTVVGTSDLLGSNWGLTDSSNDMIDYGDGMFMLFKSNLSIAAGASNEFKIAKDHAWGESYPSQNYVLKYDNIAISNILITFNSTTHGIDVFTSMTIAGDEGLMGSNWNTGDTSNDMTYADGNYTLKKYVRNLSAGTHYFKAAKDHAWNNAWGSDANTDAQIVISEAGDYIVEFTFSPKSYSASATATKVESSVSASVSSVGYATFSSLCALFIPADGAITAYRADRIENGEIIFKKVSGNIPANTGLLLKSNGEANMTFNIVDSGEPVGTNMMIATPSATTVSASASSAYNYFLSSGNNGVGFYNLAAEATSGAGKAYLHTTEALGSAGARASWSFEDDTTTGINVVKSEKQNNEVYNLNGQRVNNAVRGLYIVNGKKVIMK